MCTFCPQDKIKSKYRSAKYLSVENFKTILSKVPKHVRIDFSGMAEPWANPNATVMLRHCLQEGYRMAIYTTLYGMGDANTVAGLLTHYAPQIELICLHLPDINHNMTGWRYNETYERALKIIGGLGHGALRGKVDALTMDGGGKVHPTLWETVQELPPWIALDRAGNVAHDDDRGAVMTGPFQHRKPVFCSLTVHYNQNVVLPNGDVVLCCMDYGLKHKLGNLLKQDYAELFSSPMLKQLRETNRQHGFTPHSLCKSCERAQTY